MGYDNHSRTCKSSDNKKRIIEAALALIEEKGYDHVSVDSITKAAGVSKGAFYIHFKSKEDLLEQEIHIFYDEFALDPSKPRFERLSHFLMESLNHIQGVGLKMCQEWFSQSVKGSFYGKSKLSYDRKRIWEILGDEERVEKVLSVYYGALNLWCFTDGRIDPVRIVQSYLNETKEELS